LDECRAGIIGGYGVKPPVCCICNRRFNNRREGGLVYFRKRPSDYEWDRTMKEEGRVGHPPYAEWFCGEHYEVAKELSGLTIDEALREIRRRLKA